MSRVTMGDHGFWNLSFVVVGFVVLSFRDFSTQVTKLESTTINRVVKDSG